MSSKKPTPRTPKPAPAPKPRRPPAHGKATPSIPGLHPKGGAFSAPPAPRPATEDQIWKQYQQGLAAKAGEEKKQAGAALNTAKRAPKPVTKKPVGINRRLESSSGFLRFNWWATGKDGPRV